MTGRKDDAGKPRYDLIPPIALADVAKVLEYGARKYAPENWRKVPDWRARYTAAALRHIFATLQGHARDAESDLPHLAHACCCLLFILELAALGARRSQPPPEKRPRRKRSRVLRAAR